MDLLSGMAVLKTAVELTRALRDAAKAGAIKPDEFAGRVGEIYDYIADSKDALADAKDQIQDLRDENKRLKAAAEEQQSFEFMHGVYWKTYTVRVGDQKYEAIYGERPQELRRDGPFCPLCRDDRGKAVRLKLEEGSFSNSSDRLWVCEIHKTDYRAPDMKA